MRCTLVRSILRVYLRRSLRCNLELLLVLQTFEKVRIVLTEEAGRDPTDEEWAAAAKVDLLTLRRHLLLGNAARNKLIQVWQSVCGHLL